MVLITGPEYFYNEDINQEEEEYGTFELFGKHVTLTPMMENHIEPLYAASLPSEIWEWSATKILSYEEAISYVKEGIRAREKGTSSSICRYRSR